MVQGMILRHRVGPVLFSLTRWRTRVASTRSDSPIQLVCFAPPSVSGHSVLLLISLITITTEDYSHKAALSV